MGMTEDEAIEFMKRYLDVDCYTDKCVNAHTIAIKALEEVQQYRAIGTVEECRAAVEQEAKKVIEKYKAEAPEDIPVGWTKSYEIVTLDDAIEIVKGGGVNEIN